MVVAGDGNQTDADAVMRKHEVEREVAVMEVATTHASTDGEV